MLVLDEDNPRSEHATAVAIGVFDGLHVGHQKVIGNLCAIARRHHVTSTVVTFDPHPALLLAPERAPLLIATMAQRLEGLERLGIEQVRVLDFDEQLAKESAQSFVERVLSSELRAQHVVVGEDFHFGHDRKGNVSLLEREGARLHFDVHPAPIFGEGQRCSSTQVREALQRGDIAQATKLLGRPFCLRARVVHGDARGREIGFPTANLFFSERQVVPALGIYAGAVLLEGARWVPGALSVGTRPQFYEQGEVLVEVHIPNFDADIYAQQIDVAFLARLRGEATFTSLEDLTQQMERDVEETVTHFKDFSPKGSVLLR